jgi:hypothetical protein
VRRAVAFAKSGSPGGRLGPLSAMEVSKALSTEFAGVIGDLMDDRDHSQEDEYLVRVEPVLDPEVRGTP